MPLSRLLYFSKRVPAHVHKLDREIDDILVGCRAFNKEHEISGILLADHEFFLQMLEGRRPNVNAAYKRILDSSRHTDVMLCDFRAIDKRIFSEFQMLYQPMESVLSKIVQSMADTGKPADVFEPETVSKLLGLYRSGEFQCHELTEARDLVA